MTRILAIVIPDFPPTGMVYGAERSFADLAMNLGLIGASVYALEPSGLFASDDNTSGFQQLHIESGPLFLLRSTLRAIKLVRQFRSDIIFAYHSDHISSVIPGYIASLITGTPFFLGVLDDRMIAEDRLSFDELLSFSISIEDRLKHAARRFILSVTRRLACRYAICLTPTNHIASYASECLHPRNVFVIGRGVNDVWFSKGNDEGAEMYDACFVGRIDPNKGITTLFGAWKKVIKTRPDAKLLVVGEAWPGMFPIYYKQIEDLQISKNVVFAGYFPDEISIRKLLRSSKIFVLPSKLEGLSRSVLEAMASGLPCILGDIPTAKEIFGDAAIFVQTGNEEALAGAILNLLQDKGRREELSRRSVSIAKQFTWKNVAVRTLNIMDSTLTEKKQLAF